MSKANKLYARLLASKKGWKLKDLESLYLSFGFEKIEGGKHILFIHPIHKELRATVTRHGDLAIGYLQHAQKIIDELQK